MRYGVLAAVGEMVKFIVPPLTVFTEVLTAVPSVLYTFIDTSAAQLELFATEMLLT